MKKSSEMLVLLVVLTYVSVGNGRGIETEDTSSSCQAWPVLKHYDQDHIARIALPLGGIGTGTVSLGGRGDLRDWEIMNRPAKGFNPGPPRDIAPFFALYVRQAGETVHPGALEGPVDLSLYEGAWGSPAKNHGLPRFRRCTFRAAYPLGQIMLSDPDIPVSVRLKAFNPLIPGDVDSSSIPVAVLKYVITNQTDRALEVSVCGAVQNFIGMDGWEVQRVWGGTYQPVGAKGNCNTWRESDRARGIVMSSAGVDRKSGAWGTMALTTLARTGVTYRTSWKSKAWGSSTLDFWDDFSADGELTDPEPSKQDAPMASLAAKLTLRPRATGTVTFLITWHFPNRYAWSQAPIRNYYANQYEDAWDVVDKVAPRLADLESRTVRFVQTFCDSDLPEVVKEAALFNLSTLRSQTCFRTADGLFFGWEGCHDCEGCCHGSCTHVWNYEQATAFVFGELACKMREAEFGHAVNDQGLLSFRINLPIDSARSFAKAAADGQMGCIMKMYRDWQLSGNDVLLRRLYPQVKKALEFCWIPGGWDADRDGVMEGCQHNTMDVEYYGPNPQMEIWYLGALRACAEMAEYLEDRAFAGTCRALFTQGSTWTDRHLFNEEYYEHQIRAPQDPAEIAPALRVGMGAKDATKPDYQLGSGCLVDQLVGQFMAHVCHLGYLTKSENVQATLRSIMKYNHRDSLRSHFNCFRSYALGDEAALLMASYPHGRPENPFPYFTEVMTGFEYTAAVGMLYEGQLDAGLQCIKDIRDRYDGRKRSPFDEAECGHHYARAMASWAAVLALSDFHYSAVTQHMTICAKNGTYFWSHGYGYGTIDVAATQGTAKRMRLRVIEGELRLRRFSVKGLGTARIEKPAIKAGESYEFTVNQNDAHAGMPEPRQH